MYRFWGWFRYVVLLAGVFAYPVPAQAEPVPWTVMIYGGTDSSAEAHIMPHLKSLIYLSKKGHAGEVVLLYDRARGYTDDAKLFGENFEDTRLFRLHDGQWERVAGGSAFPEITLNSTYEANTGDANTLGKFIRFCKSTYPASRYALIVFGHGECRRVCPDLSTSEQDDGKIADAIYTAELTETLGEEEGVDLIWFDVCSFGGIANAYQLRPGNGGFFTRAMVATPPVSSPAPMRHILKKAGIVGQTKENAKLPKDGLAFGTIVVQMTEKSVARELSHDPGLAKECWGLYDLSRADQVKSAVDALAVALAAENGKDALEAIRGSGEHPVTLNYLHSLDAKSWTRAAHFDLYDLARRVHEYTGFSAGIRQKAEVVMEAVDRFIAASFAADGYQDFEPGKNGLFILFPDGDAVNDDTTHWAAYGWYHPDDRSHLPRSFGRYAWCRDGAIPGNQKVENWYELLDAWFDEPADDGGVNGYRW